MKIVAKIIFLQLALLGLASCWWDTGHMLVAKVAETVLLKEDKEAFDLSQRLTNVLNIFSHNLITNFVESACWPDDVKTFGLKSMDEWHFIDLPVRFPELIEKSNITFRDDDALGTLKQCYKVLTTWDKKEVENLHVQFEKSMMARYLVHVVGDIHQPLHASSFFDNDRFKEGDQGGNLFLINYKDGVENLHKLFDSGADQLQNIIKRPLSHADQLYLEKTANEIMKEFPVNDLPELKNDDFLDWAQESHDIAQHFIYPGITYEGTPSKEYLENAFKIVKRRIALAGYRLAAIFRDVRKTFLNPTESVEIKHEDHSGENKLKRLRFSASRN